MHCCHFKMPRSQKVSNIFYTFANVCYQLLSERYDLLYQEKWVELQSFISSPLPTCSDV